MKITAHACLESMLYEATKAVLNAHSEYLKAEQNFFENNGSADVYRNAKKSFDSARQRLYDLETTKRIITEMEAKGVEI